MLRIVLAMAVVLGHGVGYIWLIPINGNAAVYCFFIVSGFYMALVVNEKYHFKGGSTKFYLSRLSRIFPTYVAVVIFVFIYRLVFDEAQLSIFMDEPMTSLLRARTFLATFFIVGMDHLRFIWDVKMLEARFVPQAWSLEAELIFYVTCPFLLAKLSAARVAFFVIGSAALFYFQIPLLVVGAWVLLPAYLVFFSFGAIGYLLYRAVREHLWIVRHSMVISGVIAATTLLFGYVNNLELLIDPLDLKFIPIYFGIVTMIPFAFIATKNAKFDRYIGELSYPIYMVHFMIIQIATSAGFNKNGWISAVVITSIVIAVAIALHRFIQVPIERFRSRPPLNLVRKRWSILL